MLNYKNVIFDLDGTLLDTSSGILSSVKFVIKELSLGEISDNEISSFIGPPIGKSLKEKYALSDEETRHAVELFRNQYKEVDLLKARVYEGITEMLDYLQEEKICLAIATYKRYDYAQTIIDAFDLKKYFPVVEGSDFNSNLTKKDILKNAMERLGTSEEDVLFVGDTEYDRIAALELGVDFLKVGYGFGYSNESSNSDDCIARVNCSSRFIDLWRK